MPTSRIPSFYKLSVEERRKLASKVLDLEPNELQWATEAGGLDVDTADKTVENVLGTYALPLALGLNVHMNERDFIAPMVVEEPSVVAAASNAAKIIRAGGGFFADADPPLMIAQVQLENVVDLERAQAKLLAHRDEILARGNQSIPGLVKRGGGCKEIEIRPLTDGFLVIHVLVDCRDAMGANLVNTVAEAVAPRLAKLAEATIGLRILSNLADRRCVRVRCRIPADALALETRSGASVRDGIARASRFAEVDPYRAATHNKGIMNGVDAVALATGNDWRSVEAGAHAYAARRGRYEPLCVWHVNAEDGTLGGYAEMPLALGIVGGPSRVHRGARLAIKMSSVSSAQELSMLAVCVGMASNLAALRALCTDGIQRGHMALHARSVAIAAGAQDGLVELVAARIHELGDITLETAKRELKALLGGPRLGQVTA